MRTCSRVAVLLALTADLWLVQSTTYGAQVSGPRQPPTPAARPVEAIVVIKTVGDTLQAVGEAIASLTKRVATLVSTGDQSWQVLEAQRTQESLVGLSGQITGVHSSHEFDAIPAIKHYLDSPGPDEWPTVKQKIGRTLLASYGVLIQARTNRRDLMLPSAYGKVKYLMEPPYIISDLDSLPPPTSRKELKELRRLLANYRTLVKRLGAARDELNTYIDKIPQK